MSNQDQTIHLLYVDDEAPLCRAVERTLRHEADLAVMTTTSPGEALRLLNGRPFHVVIADLKMNGMNGVELLSYARHVAPDSRRILVSGCPDLSSAIDAINRGGIDRLLVKPWEPDELRSSVKAAIERVHEARASERCNAILRRQIGLLSRTSHELDRMVRASGGDAVTELAQALEVSEAEAAELLGRLS